MYVIKRDGRKEPVHFDKITARITKLSYGLNPDFCDPVLVSQKVTTGVYKGVTTAELDELAAETAASLTATHPDYALLAARIAVSNLHKGTLKSFSETIKIMHGHINPKNNQPAPLIADDVFEVIMANAERLDSEIVYDRDFDFDYFGFKTLERSYLLRVDGRVVERPQHMLMRVSVGIHKQDVDSAVATYHLLSQRWFTHASPTLFNAGTPRPQLSSCFLICMKGDSIEGIYDTLKECASISKSAGGIGLSIHNIRATGSYIRGTNGTSNGIVPMLRVFNDTARYVDQGGGKRKGAFAIYLEPWHADIFDWLELRKNHGKEEARARDLFYGLWIPDLFMRRVEAGAEWSLFCPNEAPGLADCWGEEFEALYEQYEAQGRARRSVKAQTIWFAILEAQVETGNPYMLYKDSANRKSNQQNLGTIKSSNLCTEILEYTSPGETAVCNLASIALPRFVRDRSPSGRDNRKLIGSLDAPGRYFDFDRLAEVTAAATRNLNKIIDVNYYPVETAARSNLAHRPIGLGVQGLADTFILLGLPFDSPQAKQLNRDIFEAIYFAALRTSMQLAKADGPYSSYQGSPMSRGILQPDMWGAKTSDRWDWGTLRADIASHGVRNSLLVAPMPTASTSQILGNNECFAAGTPVTLANGLSMAIEDIPLEGGVQVTSYSQAENGFTSSNVTERLDRGEKDVVRLTFLDGRTVTCTPDHRFMLADGRWCSAADIPVMGEPVLMGLTGALDKVGSDEDGWTLETTAGIFSLDSPARRARALAFSRMVGLIRSDASVWDDGVGACFGTQLDLDDFVADYKLVSQTSSGFGVTRGGYYDCHTVRMWGPLGKAIRDLEGMTSGARGASPPSWPGFVMDPACPQAVLREFLAGFFGGNGWTPGLMSNGITGSQIKTFSPIRLSQTACLAQEAGLVAAMEQLCDLLVRVGVPGAKIINTHYVKNNSGEPYRCGEMLHVCVRIGYPVDAFTQHVFMDKVGIRYSNHKSHRCAVAASWSRYLAAAQEGSGATTATKALAHAIIDLQENEPVSDKHYSLPNIHMLNNRGKRGRGGEVKQFVLSAEQFLEEVGATGWFASEEDEAAKEGEDGVRPHVYVVDGDAKVTPTLQLRLLDRRPVGRRKVYDINVAETHNFLANGLVVHNCFEPYTSNIYVRRVLSGEFTVVNQHLLSDLTRLGLWDADVKNELVAGNGSVADLDIPPPLKELYKTVWEIKQRVLVDMAADRGAFIDQSQSFNVHMPDPNFGKLTSLHFHAWKRGLKTGMYYLRTRAAADAIKFTVDQQALQRRRSERVAKAEAMAADAKENAPLLAATFTAAPKKHSTTDVDEGMERERQLAAMVCSLENKDACVMCSG